MKVCKHFGECGGCRFQDVAYEQQLENKTQLVKDLMVENNLEAELKPINHFPLWFYRNKMEFTFDDNGGLVCGMHSKLVKRTVFNMEECLIFSPDTGKILNKIREFAAKHSYPPYNRYSHKGFLRYLIVREAKFTKQLMIGIVTSSTCELDKEDLLEGLQALDLESKLTSVHHIISDSWSDAVVFDKKELLFGEEYIQEVLDGLTFNVGVDSFFQVNPVGISVLYKKIREYAALDNEKKVLDLFCGVGSIGIFLAPTAKFVWGVELGQQIVDAAWVNAKQNNIDNISFFAADARKFLNTQGSFYKDIDLLVINPPRSGLSKKIIRAILRLSPKNIIYSSCNPGSLFDNIKDLSQEYRLKLVEPFDFFPHTPHLECLTYLEKV